jgi:hypothetical protein
MTWMTNAVCVQVGTSGAAEMLIVPLYDTDPPERLNAKKAMARSLASAMGAGYRVIATHGDTDALITAVEFPGFDICPSRAVNNDFFTVSGSNLPDDVVVEFDGPAFIVSVTPDVRRPDWVLIAQLSPVIPAVRQEVRLRSPSTGWSSQAVPIDVSADPPEFVRRLYTGAPKDRSYTITFVANPVIRRNAGNLISDPVLTNRQAFHRTVAFSIDNLLGSTEDVLRANGLERSIQFACVFDGTRPTANDIALVQEDTTTIVEPLRTKFRAFTNDYSIYSDVTFTVTGSATHTRSSAWFSTDAGSGPTVTFTYDGTTFNHRRFADIPGTVALSTTAGALTPLHEFGHAVSDFNNGMIDDLYTDTRRTGLNVNKKFRARAIDPIPTTFGNYNGTAHNSDQNRDGLGYPNTWVSYHCRPLDATRPNMMDNFNFAADPRRCRLDEITRRWLVDRLAAKVGR